MYPGAAIVLAGSTNYMAAPRVPGAVAYVDLIRDTSGSVTGTSPGALASGDTIRLAITFLI